MLVNQTSTVVVAVSDWFINEFGTGTGFLRFC